MARGGPSAARPALTRLVWLCAVSVALVPPCRPCTGFVSPNALPTQPSTTRGLAKLISLRSRGALRGPAMVYSPLRPTQAASQIDYHALETFPEVPLDFTGGNRTSEFTVSAERATTSSLYGQWRPTVVPAVETTPEGLPRAAKGRFLTQTVRPEPRANGMGQRGRPRSKPLEPIKPELMADFVFRAAQVLTSHSGKMDSNLFGQHWKQMHKANSLQRYKTHQAITLHSMLSESSAIFKVSDTERPKVKMFELLECDLAALEAAALGSRAAAGEPRSPSVELRARAEAPKAAALSTYAPESAEEAEEAEQAPRKRVGRPKGKRAVGMQPVASVVAQQGAEEQHYSHVPVQGKARNSLAFDRRSAKKSKPTLRQNLELLNEEAKPAAPFSSQGDAVSNAAVKMYNSWAADGRDVVMEATHGACVEEMIDIALRPSIEAERPFTAIDAGCGNGWATRMLASHQLCEGAVGVDAAELMVQRARDLTDDEEVGEAEYVLSDVHSWRPEARVDVVLANELLYLLDFPESAVRHMVGWLVPGGRLVAGLDCYAENKLSHTWAEDLSVPMHCVSESVWEQYLRDAGLEDIQLLRSQSPGPWAGTLIITGTKPLTGTL